MLQTQIKHKTDYQKILLTTTKHNITLIISTTDDTIEFNVPLITK